MIRVILKGSPATQWQLGKGMKAGGTILKLTDEEIAKAESVNLIEAYVDGKKEIIKEAKKIYTEKELFDKDKKKQIEILNKFGITKIPRYEKGRVKAILEIQKAGVQEWKN